MTGAGDPSIPKNGGYVVPMPRVTDAIGRSLRRVFAPRTTPGDLNDLIRRLNSIR